MGTSHVPHLQAHVDVLGIRCILVAMPLIRSTDSRVSSSTTLILSGAQLCSGEHNLLTQSPHCCSAVFFQISTDATQALRNLQGLI